MHYHIRSSELQDIPFLWEMLYQSIHVPEGQPSPDRGILQEPHIEKYMRGWGRPTDHALIAIDDNGVPLGAIWVRLFDRDHAGYGFVDEVTPELGMAILPSHRGHGIGRTLLGEMSHVARAHGYGALSLSVDPRNAVALRLYERHGYVKVSEDDGGSWTMRKAL